MARAGEAKMKSKDIKALAEMAASMTARKALEEAERARRAQQAPLVEHKPATSSGPTPERLARAANDATIEDGKIDRAGERVPQCRRFRDSQIERMFAAKRITQAQLDAANWYLEQYEIAGIAGRVVANYSPAGGGEARCIGTKLLGSERQYQARQNWRAARAEMLPNLAVLVDLVVLENAIPAFANSRQRERHAAMIGEALQPMCDWLGY